MPALTIKNIPDHLYHALKNTSEQNRRSVNSEVIVCLERALLPTRMSPEERLAGIQAMRARIPAGIITESGIRQAIHEGRP